MRWTLTCKRPYAGSVDTRRYPTAKAAIRAGRDLVANGATNVRLVRA